MRPSEIALNRCAVTLALSLQSFAHRTNSWGLTMVHNPITEEIREIRHRLAAQFGNDVYRIGAELRRRQASSDRRVVRLPSR